VKARVRGSIVPLSKPVIDEKGEDPSVEKMGEAADCLFVDGFVGDHAGDGDKCPKRFNDENKRTKTASINPGTDETACNDAVKTDESPRDSAVTECCGFGATRNEVGQTGYRAVNRTIRSGIQRASHHVRYPLLLLQSQPAKRYRSDRRGGTGSSLLWSMRIPCGM